MQKDNFTQVVIRFIQDLAIPVTSQSIKDELNVHPDYNTMLAISDVLTTWRVPNAAYELNFDELLAAKIDDVFIAFISKSEFVLVSHLDNNYAIVSNERWNNHRLTTEEFKNLYSGSILVAEKESGSGEPNYQAQHRKELIETLRLPVVIGGSILLLLSLLLFHSNYIANLNWQIALLTLCKTTGLVTTILLLMQSIDSNNPIIQKLCGSDNNSNCNAILSSKAAKINDQLSWSEVGFFYFAGTWLVLLFNSGNTSVLQTLAILNIFSLPYTFYSVYHQWRVSKQWCLLCCVIQALIWLEFFAFLPVLLNSNIQLPTLAEWSSLAMGMAVPVLAWIFIKPYLLVSKQIDPLKAQLRTFKYNTELFKKLLYEGVKYSLPAEEHSLIIGNREAENIITMVSNPFCEPCAKAHKGLEWLNTRGDIKLQIIFTTDNNEYDPKTQVADHLLSLQQNRNDISLTKAIHEWYEQKHKSYDAWAKNHPLYGKANTKEALEVNRAWCKMTDITHTPTIFINGHKIPKNYQPEDFKYFI